MGGRGAGGGGKGGGGGGGGGGDVETAAFSGANYSKLNDEWEKTHKQPYGPFADMRGETGAKFYTVRKNGKLVAGATVSKQGGSTFIHSIASHSPGAGLQILNKVKAGSKSIKALSGTTSGKAFFRNQGFKSQVVPGSHNFVWTGG